jgi:hypothetical protein
MVVPVAPTKIFAFFLLRERKIEKEQERERQRVTYKEREKYSTFFVTSNFNASSF